MTRHAFLEALRRHLKPLPAAERDDIVADYDAHFRDGIDRGQSEAEVARRLGSPRQLAALHVSDAYANRLATARGPWAYARNAVRLALALLALGFLNAVVLAIPLFLGMLGLTLAWLLLPTLPAVLGVVLLVTIAKGLGWAMFGSVFGWGAALVGAGLVVAGVGAAYALALASTFLAKVAMRYVSLNIRLLKKAA